MPNNPLQLEFPYASLDFPNRAVLTANEIAVKLGCSRRQIENLIECGELGDINIGSGKIKRKSKVPIEEYRNFIIKRMSGFGRNTFLQQLPKSTLQELQNEIYTILKRK